MTEGASQITASQLFIQPFIQVEIKENIKDPRHWPFVRGIHRWPMISPRKGPVTRKMLPFDDVIMLIFDFGGNQRAASTFTDIRALFY